VGFHLFGEGYKRRVFLAGMNALYSSRGFPARGELPDHIAVVLRFLANSDADGQTREIVEDGLIPALSKMIGKFGDAGNPYGNVLRALQSVLLPAHREEAGEDTPGHTATEVGTP
jgi:nitrate reductase delta subunit